MPELNRVTITDTGIQISEVGLGTVKFGRNSGVKYPSQFEIPDDRQLSELLETAQSLGINYLDTAPAYGTSEATLGRLLRGKRNNWVVSTKVGEYFSNQSHYDFSRDQTIRSVKNSLTLLGLHELDIVYVHSDGDDQKVIQETDVLETLIELKTRGLIRAIGFSGKTVAGSRLALDVCDIFMISLNQQDLSQSQLINECNARGKCVVIKKALASGHSADPGQAMRFAHQYPGVNSVIVGSINPSHLSQNIAAIKAV